MSKQTFFFNHHANTDLFTASALNLEYNTKLKIRGDAGEEPLIESTFDKIIDTYSNFSIAYLPIDKNKGFFNFRYFYMKTKSNTRKNSVSKNMYYILKHIRPIFAYKSPTRTMRHFTKKEKFGGYKMLSYPRKVLLQRNPDNSLPLCLYKPQGKGFLVLPYLRGIKKRPFGHSSGYLPYEDYIKAIRQYGKNAKNIKEEKIKLKIKHLISSNLINTTQNLIHNDLNFKGKIFLNILRSLKKIQGKKISKITKNSKNIRKALKFIRLKKDYVTRKRYKQKIIFPRNLILPFRVLEERKSSQIFGGFLKGRRREDTGLRTLFNKPIHPMSSPRFHYKRPNLLEHVLRKIKKLKKLKKPISKGLKQRFKIIKRNVIFHNRINHDILQAKYGLQKNTLKVKNLKNSLFKK